MFRDIDTTTRNYSIPSTALLTVNLILEAHYKDANNIYALVNGVSNSIYEYNIPLDLSAWSNQYVGNSDARIVFFRPYYSNGSLSEVFYFDDNDYNIRVSRKSESYWYEMTFPTIMPYRDTRFDALRNPQDGFSLIQVGINYGYEWEHEFSQYASGSTTQIYTQKGVHLLQRKYRQSNRLCRLRKR